MKPALDAGAQTGDSNFRFAARVRRIIPQRPAALHPTPALLVFRKDIFMNTSLALFPAMLLMTITASGYALATIGMQLSSRTPPALSFAIIGLGLAGAALAEITLLRHASLPLVYLGIVVTETLLVLAYASWAHNGISLTQIGGAVLVLAGFALVCLEH